MNGSELPWQEAPSHANPAGPSIPIAIVGMACRFSGNVRNPTQLWELCANGKDGWSPIPDSRFDVKSLYHPDNSKAGRVSFSFYGMPAKWEGSLRTSLSQPQ